MKKTKSEVMEKFLVEKFDYFGLRSQVPFKNAYGRLVPEDWDGSSTALVEHLSTVTEERTPELILDRISTETRRILEANRMRWAVHGSEDDKSSDTVVFLNLNGVVSPLPKQNPYRYEIDGEFTFINSMYPVRTAVIDWLREPKNARMIWLTSSGDFSIKISEDMGGGPDCSIVGRYGTHSKSESIAAYLEENRDTIRRVIICEDDFFTVNAEDFPDITFFYVMPNSYKGLTDEHISDIDRMIGGEDVPGYGWGEARERAEWDDYEEELEGLEGLEDGDDLP